MGEQAKELVEKFRAFNEEMIAFVRNCSEEDWGRICAWEEWPVGVAARHIGAGHYTGFLRIARSIVAGDDLPELTAEEVVRRANDHARDHAGCTREEVLGYLRENGRELIDFMTGLNEVELARTGRLALIGGEITALQLLERMILLSAGKHFANMKEAVRR